MPWPRWGHAGVGERVGEDLRALRGEPVRSIPASLTAHALPHWKSPKETQKLLETIRLPQGVQVYPKAACGGGALVAAPLV